MISSIPNYFISSRFLYKVIFKQKIYKITKSNYKFIQDLKENLKFQDRYFLFICTFICIRVLIISTCHYKLS